MRSNTCFLFFLVSFFCSCYFFFVCIVWVGRYMGAFVCCLYRYFGFVVCCAGVCAWGVLQFDVGGVIAVHLFFILVL